MLRDTVTYANDNGTEIPVHRVTEDTAGGVYLTGVGPAKAVPGDLLVQDNANSWTRIQETDLNNEYRPTDEPVPDEDEVQEESDDPDDFDPSEHKVSEVKAFMVANPGQIDRVKEDETRGKARAGILNY